ncbi:MAG: HPF/RaiA family ribosome-associated protein [Vicinamibacterales bacterium]|jgi:ribosome-associated translation inhibitor RaiA
MTITVHARGFALTDALHAHVLRRLQSAIGRLGRGVTRVAVRLTDLNGPRGGVDKRCQVQVSLADRAALVVHDTRSDLYAAVDHATNRTGLALSRRLAARRR